eukprot:TRINITY_DN5956_c0_g1_i3.p1 TRINITY_DN5956_c0_g1~~TRINITY_DN5956_c0_g1_i3.p1  ORF type:complete len:242 (-),score=25.98 TRINITY_DN5956_c0_g1_i3:1064-1735(-)
MAKDGLLGGYNITVYHTFNAEVEEFQKHWWQCQRCNKVVKRSMNRKPQIADCRWYRKGGVEVDCGDTTCYYHIHIRGCNGSFIKIKEPNNQNQSSDRSAAKRRRKGDGQQLITNFVGNSSKDLSGESQSSSSGQQSMREKCAEAAQKRLKYSVQSESDQPVPSSSSTIDAPYKKDDKQVDIIDSNDSSIDKILFQCPVCHKEFGVQDTGFINRHVDDCLSAFC